MTWPLAGLHPFLRYSRPPRPASAGRGRRWGLTGSARLSLLASSAQEAWGIHWWAQHHHHPHPGRSSGGSHKAFPKSWWAAGFWDFGGGGVSGYLIKSVSGLQELIVGVGARVPLVQTVPSDATQKRNLGDVLGSVPHFVVQIARRLGCEGLKGEFSATTDS